MTKTEIENMIDGNVAWEAYCALRDGHVSKEWAIKQIERGIGDVAWAAYWMLRDKHVTTEWAIKQIEQWIGDAPWEVRWVLSAACLRMQQKAD